MGSEATTVQRQAYSSLKQILRRALPGYLLSERETMLRLSPGAGPVYARLRLLDFVGTRAATRDTIPRGARSFLFVCYGNLMRSPMAEIMFRSAVSQADLNDVLCTSAGMHAIPGTPAHPWALAALSDLSLSLADHRARLVTPELVRRSDAIFAMDFQNKAELLTCYPESSRKIFMLGAFANSRSPEIPDPYFGDLEGTRGCCRVLQGCIRELTADLVSGQTAEKSTDPK